jgi:Fe-S cluster assembly protein SufD
VSVDSIAAPFDLATLLTCPAKLPADLGATQPSWLKELRAEAVERVGALKLPTSRDEAWRFTGIAALARQSFRPAAAPPALDAADVERFQIDEAAIRLVFVDGVHAPELSSVDAEVGAPAASAIVVGTLATALSARAAVVKTYLGRHVGFRDRLFAALNTAFLQDAAVVLVPRDTQVAAPLHLLFVATQPGVASHPRILVVAEAGSTVTVIEDHVALHGGSYFTNSVAEVAVDAGATVEHVRIQRDSDLAFHVASCAVSLARASRYRSVNVALGARLSRLDLVVLQAAEGAECTLDGLALIGGSQLADTHTCIDHMKPHGTSRQLHKCIVDGAGHAVFNGKVVVRPGAQKIDSAQSSRNLLLAGTAVVDTLPQLEILADDVKCTHGATVGQLDSEEVFYLRSRGLSEEAARDLLTYAFCAEVIERIPVASLRGQLERAVLERTARRP